MNEGTSDAPSFTSFLFVLDLLSTSDISHPQPRREARMNSCDTVWRKVKSIVKAGYKIVGETCQLYFVLSRDEIYDKKLYALKVL